MIHHFYQTIVFYIDLFVYNSFDTLMKYNSEVQIKLELYELYQENIFQSKNNFHSPVINASVEKFVVTAEFVSTRSNEKKKR